MSQPTSPPGENDRIDSWKAIAAFFGRDERTVKRWEKERALPVHRLPGERGGVFAYKQDLSRWLNSAKVERIQEEPSAIADSESPTGSPISVSRDSTVRDGVENDPVLETGSLEHAPGGTVHGSRLFLVTDQARAASSAPRPASDGAKASSRKSDKMLLWVVASAACLVCAVAVLLVIRAWSRMPAETVSQSVPAPAQTTARVTYSSKVAGVDDLYLQGVYLYEQRTPDTLTHALRCFEDAIGKDGNYAPAYAGLASTYDLLREYSTMPAAEVFSKARTAAEKAIALDANLPQAHAALGFAEFFGDWHAADAEREFKTALALDQSASLSHLWYGSMLTHEARFPEAVEQLNLANRLQPASTAILSSRAYALGLGGHRAEGADMLQEMISEDRNAPSTHLRLAVLSLVEPRDIPRFIEECRRYGEMRQDKEQLDFAATADRAYRSQGEAAMWRAIVREEELQHPEGPTWHLATAKAALGENDAALADLDILFKRHDPLMLGIAIDPLLLPLHHDPRFTRLVSALGFPPVE